MLSFLISSNGSRDETGRDLCPGSRNAPWAERCAQKCMRVLPGLHEKQPEIPSHLISLCKVTLQPFPSQY